MALSCSFYLADLPFLGLKSWLKTKTLGTTLTHTVNIAAVEMDAGMLLSWKEELLICVSSIFATFT